MCTTKDVQGEKEEVSEGLSWRVSGALSELARLRRYRSCSTVCVRVVHSVHSLKESGVDCIGSIEL